MSRRLVYALLAMAAGQAAVYVVRPTTSYRLLSLGYDAGDVGLVAAAYAVLPLVAAIPLGRYSDRRHAGSLIAVGCAFEAAACALLAVADTAATLALASTILGLGHLAVALGVQDVIARESHPERHDQHFGLLTAGVSLGQLIGPLIAGAVLRDSSGSALTAATSRAMLVGAGIAGAAAVCGVLAQRHRVAGAVVRPLETRSGSVRMILATPGVPAGIFASVAVLAAADIFTAYMPVLGEERGITPGAVSVLLAVRAAASMAARLGIGGIVARVGRLRLITISALASGLAFAGIALLSDLALLLALSAVAGFGLGFGQPLSMTLVAQLVPPDARATALSVRISGNRIGQIAAPAAAGVVAGAAGSAAAFWLLAAVLAASGVVVQRSSAGGLAPRR
ncbi:MAG TPA: MFS transporter [Gaiellaceae bacterium]|nr:MFS transporter [Gaiellaceae bacterium]